MLPGEKRNDWVDSGPKRAFDVFGVIIVAPLLACLLIVLVAVILCVDKTTPVIQQTRIGKDGVSFQFYKLNTMAHIRSTDSSQGANDVRATSIGKWLRLTTFDEMPQILINVLRGDMALVGPRPLLQVDIDLMKRQLNKADFQVWFAAYCAGRPGWTGKFGVSSRRLAIQSPAYLKSRQYHDITYRQDASWWLDVKIIWRHAMLPHIDTKRRQRVEIE